MVIRKARTEGRAVHFAKLMDICHLKNSDLEQKFIKYKGRVVLQGDDVKDDSGSHAVFTKTRIISISNDDCDSSGRYCRLPGCARPASDAVWAFSQV